MRNVDISIIVTTYNRWDLCLEALASVCDQDDAAKEIILVDDSSTDIMPSCVESFINRNDIQFFRHKTNKGLAAARNTAIRIASGEYFSFCDDDDKWPKGMAAGLLRSMEIAPDKVDMGIGLSRIYAECIDANFEQYPKLRDLMRQGVTPPVGSQIFRTSLVRKVDGYTNNVKSGVDHDLWISLARTNPRVAIASGFSAIVGADPKRDRLTTKEALRRESIARSLQIWKSTITESFGPSFYQHFAHCYYQYLEYKFFRLDLRRGHFLKACHRLKNPLLLQNIGRIFFDKILKRPRFNSFPPCDSKNI